MKVRTSAEVEERIARLTADRRCLGCEAEMPPEAKVRRGLCDTCYQGMKYAVRKRRITEIDLMRAGNLLPPSPGGRKPSNQFTASLHQQN